MTNGDRIRQMTDEELFYFLENITDCCYTGSCEFCEIKKKKVGICDIEEWLKQEVEDEQND